jgi:plastocyanin
MKTLAALALGAFALGGSSPAPSRVQIVAKEYSYSLSRLHVKAGTAILELDNLGQDSHDLRVERVGSKRIAKLGKVAPGAYADLTLHLPPGRYLLWCSIADHRKLGMHATLIVTR